MSNIVLPALVFGGVTAWWWLFGERKTPVELLCHRLSLMETKESIEEGRNFKPRPTDTFVVSYPKCGTTWTQQILHALRSNGDMSFGEITQVTPWDILAKDCGVDLNAEQTFNPRVFKSHEGYSTMAKGGRYVYVLRDPRDVLVSFHKFLTDYCGLPTTAIPLHTFAKAIYLGSGTNSGTYWDHIRGWFDHWGDANVLVVFYEDLKEDSKTCIQKIADFIGVPCDQTLLDLVAHTSSFGFMSSHSQQFDGHFVRDHVKERMQMANTEIKVGKVRKGGGKVGSGKKALTPALLAAMDERWEQTLAATTGIKSYAELRSKYSLLLPKDMSVLVTPG